MIVRTAPADEPIRDVAGNIPLPSPRPMSPAEEYRAVYIAYGTSLQEAKDLRVWARLIQPRPIPPEKQNVRTVGAKFLPDYNEDFARIAMGSADPANEVLSSILAWIDLSVVSTAVAEEESTPAATQVASAE